MTAPPPFVSAAPVSSPPERDAAPAIVFDDVTVKRRRTRLVDSLSLSIPSGSFFALIGRSGAGKTTTLRLSLGLMSPSKGKVRTLGLRATALFRRPGDVGAVLDRSGLQPQLSLAQNIRAHARLHGSPSGRLDEWLTRLDLTRVAHRRASRLSQGETQRAMLARALLLEPTLLVLDEPLVHLDPASAATALELLREVHRGGTTILVSSHHLDYVERAATHLAFVHAGKVLLQGPLQDLLRQQQRWYRVQVTPLAEAHAWATENATVQEVGAGARDGELRLRLDDGDPAALNAALQVAGFAVARIQPEEDSLDALFRDALARAETSR